jgi:hypothetical protein
MAMMVPAFITAVVLYGLSLLGLPLIDTDNLLLQQVLGLSVVLFVTMNVAQYLVVMFITMGLAANSIAREKQNRTWDTLLLTDLDARRIVWGKWWASLRAEWGDHLMVGVLRLGLLGFTFAAVRDNLPGESIFGLPIGLTYIPVLTLLVLSYTAMDAAFTAMLGVTVPLLPWSGAVGAAIVMAVRVVMLVVLLGITLVAIYTLGEYNLAVCLGVGLAGMIITIAIIWLGLRLGEWLAVLQQVSPAARR